MFVVPSALLRELRVGSLLVQLQSALGDRYRFEREIGAGGMATVFLAQDTKHDRKVAVKVLRPDIAASLGADRFLREIQIAARLQHPHILPLHDSGAADGFLFYVMPFVEGESLRRRLEREGELPVADTVRILRDIVDALTEAHAHGVVHRDIKPENVLLRGRHALVADFGVAKAVSEATGRQKHTTVGVSLGTPAYMAPEQAAADPNIDHRVDIYAVGILGYELLAGRTPFEASTPQQTLAAHVTETPKAVTAHRESVPPVLAAAVMRCLEKKPADRWQTAEELLSQLEAAATPSGGVTPTGLQPVAPMRLWRRPALLWTLAAVVVAAATSVWAVRSGAGSGGNYVESMPPVDLRPLTANPPENALHSAAISPDGNYLAYVDPGGIHLQIIATGEVRTLQIPEGPVPWTLGWFPDGTRLYFLARGDVGTMDLWTVPLLGGTPRPIHAGVITAAVSPDGSLIAAITAASERERQFREIRLMGPAGENPRVLLEAASDESFWQLAWSPTGRRLAFGVMGSRRAIESVDLDGASRATLVTSSSLFQNWVGVLPFVWCETGRLVFSRRTTRSTSNVWTLETDPERGVPAGEPVRRTYQAGQNVRQLSATADCSRVAALMIRNQSDVWVADLEDGGRRLANEVQATSDEREDFPSAWSGDGQTLFFGSDRTGNMDLYGTRPGSGIADPVAQTPVTGRIASWDSRTGSLLMVGDSGIYRVPDEGAHEQVAAGSFDRIRCRPSRCVLARRDGVELVFSTLDPAGGEVRELRRIGDRPPFTEWALSPDGSTVAIVHNDDDIVRLVELDSGEERPLRAQGWASFEFVDWAADGRAVFLNAGFAIAGVYPVLLHVGLDGVATVLRDRHNTWHIMPLASPDGRRLAFGSMPFHGNAWLLTGF